MERFPCEPDNQFCKYYEAGCFEDTHHLFKRSEATSRLHRTFCELPDNKLTICRRLHELLEHSEGWPPYPEAVVMQTVVERER